VADYNLSITFVLTLEDSSGRGKVTVDSDGTTRYGLLDRWHPDLTAQGFYTMPADQALIVAKTCYRTQYWNHISGDGITSNTVATQIFSIAVNDGITWGTKLAQGVLGLNQDGVLGDETLTAINNMDPVSFISAYNVAAKSRYAGIVEAHPEKAGDLKGWYNRVDLISTFKG
jgi:lysozyme family protein